MSTVNNLNPFLIFNASAGSGKTFSIAPGTNTITTQPPGTKVASFTVNGTLTVD